MLRSALVAITFGAFTLGAVAAYACEGDCPCARKHQAAAAKKDGKPEAKAQKDGSSAKPADTKQPAPAVKDETKPTQGALDRDAIDQIYADKVMPVDSVKPAAKHQMIAPLKGDTAPMQLPVNARSDARAGVFI